MTTTAIDDLIAAARAAIGGQLGSPSTPARTLRNVARLDPAVRRQVAALFAGRRVTLTIGRDPDRTYTVVGRLITVAMPHVGTVSDLAILADERDGLATPDGRPPRITTAYPLADVRTIEEL